MSRGRAPQRARPTLRLHRMTVEIRDALLRLRPYRSGRCAVGEWDTVRMVAALDAHRRGLAAEISAVCAVEVGVARGGEVGGVRAMAVGAPVGGDRQAEPTALLALARDWPAAVKCGARQMVP